MTYTYFHIHTSVMPALRKNAKRPGRYRKTMLPAKVWVTMQTEHEHFVKARNFPEDKR